VNAQFPANTTAARLALLLGMLAPALLAAQAPGELAGVPAELRGRTVEGVRVTGNRYVPTSLILNQIRTREGEPFDPATVEADYQRVYNMRSFGNVEARVEPTPTGVIVSFHVSEERQITSVSFIGNRRVSTALLQGAVEVRPGDAIDPFRIAVAQQMLEELYRSRNYPYAHVRVLPEPLTQHGELIFRITEGPNVRVRMVEFKGNRSFTDDRLRAQVRTRHWLPLLRAGTFDFEQVSDDVLALQRFYQNKGFFDVRVGRKITVSPDQSELLISYLVNEGRRYRIERVTFRGNVSLSEEQLREHVRMLEGRPYDGDILQRDIRRIVRAYSPFGYIYQPQAADPDYLRIDARPVFRREPGTIELVYDIHEGRPFTVGRIIVTGNTRTHEKTVLREMRLAPGELYDSSVVQEASERIRHTPYYDSVTITPIGDQPHARDILIEVNEARTASFTVGAGFSTNGGIMGNITLEQRNFDIANWPASWRDIFSDRAFIGAGQQMRITLEPGTRWSNASIRFVEPWLFDQPYALSVEGYLQDRLRERYRERRTGGNTMITRRFGDIWSLTLGGRGENVRITSIRHPEVRAPEILEMAGNNTLTTATLEVRRNTTNPGGFIHRGSDTSAKWEPAGVFGGDFTYHRFTASWNFYQAVAEDLLERRTVLSLHADAGYIGGNAPFFERFYGGGVGSVRGFRFRGISPRSGPAGDPVGGDFFTSGTVELNFPLTGDNLRGVVFVDAGTVEEDFRFGTMRVSAGFGIRLVVPLFGQMPLALDFGFPISRRPEDDRQLISFTMGLTH
jgi:outer membrane protein insertion porin family